MSLTDTEMDDYLDNMFRITEHILGVWEESPVCRERFQESGSSGLCDLAKEIAEAFWVHHKDSDWGELDWRSTLADFTQERL